MESFVFVKNYNTFVTVSTYFVIDCTLYIFIMENTSSDVLLYNSTYCCIIVHTDIYYHDSNTNPSDDALLSWACWWGGLSILSGA